MITILNTKTYKALCLICFFLTVSCKKEVKTTSKPVAFHDALTSQYVIDLNNTIAIVNQLKQTKDIDSLKSYYKKARTQLKRLEPILAFYRSATYKALNQPNLPTLHEDSNGVVNEKPQGFQVLEEALFDDIPDTTTVKRQIHNIANTLRLEKDTYTLKNIKDYHFMWLLRDSFIRMMSLGIVGFDSPMLQNSIPETATVITSLQNYINLYDTKFQNKQLFKNWQTQLNATSKFLNSNTNFDTFNRYVFIKDHIHPLLKLWKQTVDDWNIKFPLQSTINNDAESFFANNTFNINSYKPRYSAKLSDASVALGKHLFYDNRLSAKGDMACATCHDPKKYFTDGFPKAIGNKKTPLQRNSPTLYYAVLQGSQFYDGRAANLENQIIEVANNEDEFHTNVEQLVKVVNNDSTLKNLYKKAYTNNKHQERNIRNAIANYIRTLTPFNSKFDRNISGIENTLTESEINGFNIFMGKGQCATCHFAPTFNGTVPPHYKESEYEVLGVPSKAVFKNAKIDSDIGRYALYPAAKKRKHAFKTSTVRNIAKTAPYMHNGIYNTLEEVMQFYNVGGGAGIGIHLDNQTLPEDALNLTDKEIQDVIAFMNTLTDDVTKNDY